MVLMLPLSIYLLLFRYRSRLASIVTEYQKRRLCTARSNPLGDQGPAQGKLPSPVQSTCLWSWSLGLGIRITRDMSMALKIRSSPSSKCYCFVEVLTIKNPDFM